MRRNPAEFNNQWCRQGTSREKLSRSLNLGESHKVWNTGSFYHLEQIGMAVDYAKTAVEVEEYLVELPVREPQPAENTRRE